MRRGSSGLALPVLVMLAMLLGSNPPPAATAATPSTAVPTSTAAIPVPGEPVTGPVFDKPGQGAIRRVLVDDIRNTPRRSRIDVVTWTFTSQPLARELVRASRRGVVVRVLVGSASCRDATVRRMSRTLAGRSEIRCAIRSARGASIFDGERTNLHQKSWTFSRVGSARDVTVVTSANATRAAEREQYDDAYQLVGRSDVHRAMTDVFDQQWRDRTQPRPYRTVELTGGGSLAFTPWNGPGMTDPVLTRIRSLPALGTTIRVAQSNWSDERGVRIARALARKQRAGADVAVLASRPFGAEVRRVVLRAGIPVRSAWFGPRRYHHLKFMTASYVADGVPATRVWTGSENWWSPSRGHDELVLELTDAAAHDAYTAFFDDVADDR